LRLLTEIFVITAEKYPDQCFQWRLVLSGAVREWKGVPIAMGLVDGGKIGLAL
jgi:hypothetical protein